MKKLFVCMLAVSAFVFSASAQDQRVTKGKKDYDRSGQDKGMMRGKMMKDMNFTDAQRAQMKANQAEMKSKMDALKANTSLTEEQRKQQRAVIMQEQKAKMESILTAEQKATMAARQNDKGLREKGNKNGKYDEMKAKLDLSNEQAEKLKSLHEQTRTQAKTIRDNTSLTDAARKEQLSALKTSTKEQQRTILNKEQLKKMREMKHQEGQHKKRKK